MAADRLAVLTALSTLVGGEHDALLSFLEQNATPMIYDSFEPSQRLSIAQVSIKIRLF